MQSVSSRIWTRIAMCISYDDNHNTTGTSKYNNRDRIGVWIASGGYIEK